MSDQELRKGSEKFDFSYEKKSASNEAVFSDGGEPKIIENDFTTEEMTVTAEEDGFNSSASSVVDQKSYEAVNGLTTDKVREIWANPETIKKNFQYFPESIKENYASMGIANADDFADFVMENLQKIPNEVLQERLDSYKSNFQSSFNTAAQDAPKPTQPQTLAEMSQMQSTEEYAHTVGLSSTIEEFGLQREFLYHDNGSIAQETIRYPDDEKGQPGFALAEYNFHESEAEPFLTTIYSAENGNKVSEMQNDERGSFTTKYNEYTGMKTSETRQDHANGDRWKLTYDEQGQVSKESYTDGATGDSYYTEFDTDGNTIEESHEMLAPVDPDDGVDRTNEPAIEPDAPSPDSYDPEVPSESAPAITPMKSNTGGGMNLA